jgi:hypothetical protein
LLNSEFICGRQCSYQPQATSHQKGRMELGPSLKPHVHSIFRVEGLSLVNQYREMRNTPSLRMLRSLFSNAPIDQNPQSIETPTNLGQEIHSLLSIPTELLEHIANLLPLRSKVCLALSCHRLKDIAGSGCWQALKSERREKAAFLQLLRRDQPGFSSSWLCYNCAKFHKNNAFGFPTLGAQHEWDPTSEDNEYNETYSGFPFCNSPYTQAYEFMNSALQRPLKKNQNGSCLDAGFTSYWHGYGDDGKTSMQYKIYPKVAGTHFILFTSYRYSARKYNDFNNEYFSAMNLDICPHFRLGGNYTECDGSFAKKFLSAPMYGGPGNICQTCCLEIDVEFKTLAFGMGALIINVWQDLGWAKHNIPSQSLFSRFHHKPKPSAKASDFSRGIIQPGDIRTDWEKADVLIKPQIGDGDRDRFRGRYVTGYDEPLWVSAESDLRLNASNN